MIKFVFVWRSIAQENFPHTHNSKKNLIKLKYDLRVKVFTHFVKIKTELGADISLILSFGWWLVKYGCFLPYVVGKFLSPLPCVLPIDDKHAASL